MPFTTKEILQAAGLYCEGMPIHDIASTLPGRSEAEIRQMLQEALKMGYFRYDPVLTINTMDEDLYKLLDDESMTLSISVALKDTLLFRHVEVGITLSPPSMFTLYDAGSSPEQANYTTYLEAESDSLRMVGRRAGQRISALLFNGREHIIGVNYGLSVLFTLEAMSPLPSRGSNNVTTVSLFGDLGFNRVDDVTRRLHHKERAPCNELVSMFAGRLGAPEKAVLLQVPVFIPHAFQAERRMFENILRFLTEADSYRRIFGEARNGKPGRDQRALISQMDTIVTGVGAADDYTRLQTLLGTWLSPDELRTFKEHAGPDGIVGDLGGHFIAARRDGATSQHLEGFLDTINARHIAAKPMDFAAVAERHARNPSTGAGVVCVAAGARKANVLFALLKQVPCPISMLFVDTHCALALLNLIDPPRYKRLTLEHGERIMANYKNWSRDTQRLIPKTRE